MTDLTTEPAAQHMTELELGKLLGQRKAFALVAGRCSAEQAAALKKIHDEKGYERVAPTWEEFCNRELRISRRHATRIIRWYEEFGQAYFELVQLAPISPEEYRALAPVVVDHQLQVAGRSIALIPEKAEEVAAAVAELRQSAAARPRPSARQRIATLEKQCNKLAAEFQDLRAGAPKQDQLELLAILMKTIGELEKVQGWR